MNTNEKRMDGKQHAKPDPATTYYYITLWFLIDLHLFAFIRGSKVFWLLFAERNGNPRMDANEHE